MYVKVKDVRCLRDENPHAWYREKIIAFGYDGVFTQANGCPVYYTAFSEDGKTIKRAR